MGQPVGQTWRPPDDPQTRPVTVGRDSLLVIGSERGMDRYLPAREATQVTGVTEAVAVLGRQSFAAAVAFGPALAPDPAASLRALAAAAPDLAVVVVDHARPDALALLAAGAQDVLDPAGLDTARLAWVLRAATERARRNADLVRQSQRDRAELVWKTRSLAFTEALLDSVTQAVVALDGDGRITTWNDGAARMFGWPKAEAIGCRAGALLGPGIVDAAAASTTAGTGADGPGFGTWVRRRDGARFPALLDDTRVVDAAGGFVARIVVVTDLSGRNEDAALVQRLSAIIQSSTDAILSKTPDGIITTWNRAAEQLYGYAASEVIGRHISILVPPERRDELDGILARVSSGEAVERMETLRRRKDGTVARVLLSASPLFGQGGEVVGALTLATDITERVAAQAAREEAERRFEASFRRSWFGMAITDLDGRLTVVNPALCELLGRTPDDLVGHRLSAYSYPQDPDEGQPPLTELPGGLDSYSDERRFLHHDGSPVWLQLSVNLVRSGDDEPAYFMVQMQDITERKQMERELSHRAMHDDLTGLPNRALLNNRLEHAVGASRRTGKQIGLVFLDVDGFKDLNDALGHAAGDQLLVQVGERLAASVRPGDTVARFGGDEFVIVCADVTVDTMTALAGRIGDAMEPVFELEGRSVSLRASLGITISRPGSSAESLLSEADTAMYRAKELSRGGAAVFDESLRTRAAALLEGERSLRRALGQEEFHVYYQPVIDMRTEQAVGVEALVRWHTPDGRVVLPDEFIPMAERSGLIVGLGEIVLAQASAEVVRWNSRSPEAEPLWVSVNLSARQLGEAHLVELVDRVLTESGLPASLLHFEVAESVVMHDVDRSIEVLRDLRRLGVGLAIDDFGTGASSLAHLKQLPVDTLKVDRSLVANLGTDANGTSIVKAVIGLGRALGMRCLAEGVETGEQASALDELGCQLGQGYLWSRPLGPPDADLWAAARVRS